MPLALPSWVLRWVLALLKSSSGGLSDGCNQDLYQTVHIRFCTWCSADCSLEVFWMDVIQSYINLFISGFAVGVAMIGEPVMIGSVIGWVYNYMNNK